MFFTPKGEEICLSKAISTTKARGQVEKWLLELECEMKETILMQIQTTFKNYSTESFDGWILQYTGQCVMNKFSFFRYE